jgi:hypothetical protein
MRARGRLPREDILVLVGKMQLSQGLRYIKQLGCYTEDMQFYLTCEERRLIQVPTTKSSPEPSSHLEPEYLKI